MKRALVLAILSAVVNLSAATWTITDGIVSNLKSNDATYGKIWTGQLTYDLSSTKATVWTWLEISKDSGATWSIRHAQAIGAVAETVPGTGKIIYWLTDGGDSADFRFRVRVNDEFNYYLQTNRPALDTVMDSPNECPKPIPQTDPYMTLEMMINKVYHNFDLTNIGLYAYKLPSLAFDVSAVRGNQLYVGFGESYRPTEQSEILKFRATYMRIGNMEFGIVSKNSIRNTVTVVTTEKQAIQDALGIPKENIIINWCHEHYSDNGELGSAESVAALREAKDNAVAVKVAKLHLRTGAGWNYTRYGQAAYTYTDGPIDDNLFCLLFKDLSDNPVGSWVRFTGHGASAGNLSVDMQTRWGGTCAFFNGHAGTMNVAVPAEGGLYTPTEIVDLILAAEPSAVYEDITEMGVASSWTSYYGTPTLIQCMKLGDNYFPSYNAEPPNEQALATAAILGADNTVVIGYSNGRAGPGGGYYNWNTTTGIPYYQVYHMTQETIRAANIIDIVLEKSETDTTAPTVPANLFAMAASQSVIHLAWDISTDDTNVSGYKLFRDGVHIASLVSPSFSDTGLATDTSYTYEVSAFDAAGHESAKSTPVSERTFSSADRLEYVTTIFNESSANTGVIGNKIRLSLIGDTFTGANGIFNPSNYNVTALPAGLSVSVVKLSDTGVQVSLYGTADSHESADSINNLGLQFSNSAFTGGSAGAILNSTRNDLTVNFFTETIPVWLKLDASNGLIAENSGTLAQNGALIGNPVWTTTGGRFGGALAFDGVGDYVNYGQPAELSFKPTDNDFTMSLWCKTTDGGDLISKISNYQVQYRLTISTTVPHTLYAYCGNTTATAATGVISDNSWHLVTLVNNATTNRYMVYIDGVAATGSISCGSQSDNGMDILIGATRTTDNTTTSSFYSGWIDDVRIYNRTLSLAEIQALYTESSWTITATAGTGGTISPSGSVIVSSGANRTFTISPDSGYIIDELLIDSVSVTAVSSYTFTNVTANHTISANFSAVPSCTITATAGANGNISPSGSVVVTNGANQTFSITPSAGYHIATVLVDGTNNPTAVSTGSYTFSNVTANHTIAASFLLTGSTTWTITASADAGGSISPSGSVVVNDGSDQSFTIIADAGNVIDALTVDGVPVTAAAGQESYVLNLTSVSADAAVSATFKLAPASTKKKKSQTSCALVGGASNNGMGLFASLIAVGYWILIRRSPNKI